MKKNKDEILVAVAGQPNSGKSTTFNMLTGAKQFIANYPGVTVEKKTGIYSYSGQKVNLVDLPGTYSLTSYSLEERVARDFLIHEEPDLVLDIVDASNLERNLILTFQLLEMGIPMVVALNMMDVAQNRGLEIDVEILSQELGVRVIPIIAKKGKGKKELCQAILETYNKAKNNSVFRIDYGETLEPILADLEKKISADKRFAKYSPRWLAVKLMANDSKVKELFS